MTTGKPNPIVAIRKDLKKMEAVVGNLCGAVSALDATLGEHMKATKKLAAKIHEARKKIGLD